MEVGSGFRIQDSGCKMQDAGWEKYYERVLNITNPLLKGNCAIGIPSVQKISIKKFSDI